MTKKYELIEGVSIPIIGYGTFKIDNASVEKLVVDAIESGYDHIDTATAYGNELGIGYGLDQVSIKREDLFITTKVANEDQGYNETLRAVERSLASLNVDYLDLVLIHWPNVKSAETWAALESMVSNGKIKAIGVSNFHQQHMDKLLETAVIKPVINQVERHPYNTQTELEQYCNDLGIVMQAWSPLAKGEVFSDILLKELAEKYNKSIAQIVMRWQVQSGWLAVVKASTKERMRNNLDVHDFELTQDDMDLINGLDKGHRTGSNPDNFEF